MRSLACARPAGEVGWRVDREPFVLNDPVSSPTAAFEWLLTYLQLATISEAPGCFPASQGRGASGHVSIASGHSAKSNVPVVLPRPGDASRAYRPKCLKI